MCLPSHDDRMNLQQKKIADTGNLASSWLSTVYTEAEGRFTSYHLAKGMYAVALIIVINTLLASLKWRSTFLSGSFEGHMYDIQIK